ncbi:PucR family transcriptional regulator [Kutzneria albida]|uniref:Uncharacterized protein n=1 Tax=Kutzneria albida DSM 43870 TaxID=1449976 RepID=W5WDI2_9PSEU|nr:helix-turn-helix domain-containing protein [Kutzneria albida]AHH96249.1 hypothetical protein KALB_2881 [Kutzneria albida DSM 43870]
MTRATASALPGLWSALPPQLAALLGPRVREVAVQIEAEVQHCVPELYRPGNPQFGADLTAAIESAVAQFVDRLADPDAPQADRAKVFRDLGLVGPSLDALQTAYRVGARAAWREVSRLCRDARVPIRTQCLIAEAIFAYIDELSALSVEGHALARAAQAGSVERRRRQLLELILSGVDSASPALTGLAEAVHWPVPERVLVVALEGTEPALNQQVDPRVLVDLEGEQPCMVVSDQDRDLVARVAEGLPRSWRAAAGPGVPLGEAQRSLVWAHRTLGLLRRGLLAEQRLTWFDNHMSQLWLLLDPFMVRQMSERALAPLAELTGKQHTKLSETLLAWLETRGSAEELAQRLDIHPQTVRYRMRQLEKLFGDQLAAPGARFDLEVSLRARRSLELVGELDR